MLFSSRYRWIATVALSAAAVACNPAPPEQTPTDGSVENAPPGTYIGSWSQPVSDGWSTITIAEGPDGPLFSWTAKSSRETVRCDAPGICRAYRGETPQFEYRFRIFERPDSPFLFVECQGTPLDPRAGVPLRYVDRLELGAGGQELWAHTIEAEGFSAKPPVRLARIPN